MNIKKLHIKGFKSLADFQLKDVSPFLVFAGANGSGKSNIADALAFMGAVVKFGASQA
ncbi:AAA family ATPase, partial [Pseudomonas asplenii]